LARVPNAEKAIIDANKLHGYVLSSVHPIGRFKAAFFQKLGYSAEDWESFERQLRELLASTDAAVVEGSQYGQKFVVEGLLIDPGGEPVQIVTVWVILRGEDVPRFVTAYPGGSR